MEITIGLIIAVIIVGILTLIHLEVDSRGYNYNEENSILLEKVINRLCDAEEEDLLYLLSNTHNEHLKRFLVKTIK